MKSNKVTRTVLLLYSLILAFYLTACMVNPPKEFTGTVAEEGTQTVTDESKTPPEQVPSDSSPPEPEKKEPTPIITVKLTPNGTVSEDLDRDGSMETITTLTIDEDIEYGTLQTKLTIETKAGKSETQILYPLSSNLLAGDLNGDGSTEILVISDTGGNGGMGSVVFDLLTMEDGIFKPCTASFLGAECTYFNFDCNYTEFPSYRVGGIDTNYSTNGKLTEEQQSDPAFTEFKQMSVDSRAGFVNLVVNESGTGYYIAVHQQLYGDNPSAMIGRCITYLRLEQGQPVIYKQEFIDLNGPVCSDLVCIDYTHYPAVHMVSAEQSQSAEQMGSESNVIYADKIEIPDFFKTAVQTSLAAYESYKQPGVPFLPVPLEKLCYNELKQLREDVANGDTSLLVAIDNQIALIEQSLSEEITQNTKVDLKGDGQQLSIKFSSSKVTIANILHFDMNEYTKVSVRKAIISKEPQNHRIYVTQQAEESLKTVLIDGTDNRNRYYPMDYYYEGDYRFDGSGQFTMEAGESYPVEIMSVYQVGNEEEWIENRIAYTSVSLSSNVNMAKAIILPGMDDKSVTFAAGEKLWVIDARSRYVALMNEKGDIGFLMVGADEDTNAISESDRHASAVHYALEQNYYYILDNQNNKYLILDTFEGFNCQS